MKGQLFGGEIKETATAAPIGYQWRKISFVISSTNKTIGKLYLRDEYKTVYEITIVQESRVVKFYMNGQQAVINGLPFKPFTLHDSTDSTVSILVAIRMLDYFVLELNVILFETNWNSYNSTVVNRYQFTNLEVNNLVFT